MFSCLSVWSCVIRGWLFVSLLSCVFGSSVYWLFVCELICMCLRLRVWFVVCSNCWLYACLFDIVYVGSLVYVCVVFCVCVASLFVRVCVCVCYAPLILCLSCCEFVCLIVC